MKTELSRRSFITHASIAAGGVALTSIGACSSDSNNSSPAPSGPTGPTAKDFPYEQFLPAGYTITASQKSAIAEAGYHGFWAAGCCHGVYKAVMEHFSNTVGAPFDQLPLNIGAFGGGGIGGYGSICGAILGGVLALNNLVATAAARTAMLQDLMRWYEGNAFPAYVPATIDPAESASPAPTLDFSAGNIVNLQVTPHNHLCHASRSQWCMHNGVAANSKDLSARCGRLTADVAGKVVDMMNAYLANHAYTAAAIDTASSTCIGCHTASSTTTPNASGMSCTSCHPNKTTVPHP
jgi:hypothetical protein